MAEQRQKRGKITLENKHKIKENKLMPENYIEPVIETTASKCTTTTLNMYYVYLQKNILEHERKPSKKNK